MSLHNTKVFDREIVVLPHPPPPYLETISRMKYSILHEHFMTLMIRM